MQSPGASSLANEHTQAPTVCFSRLHCLQDQNGLAATALLPDTACHDSFLVFRDLLTRSALLLI
jgi:hypothetical protein